MAKQQLTAEELAKAREYYHAHAEHYADHRKRNAEKKRQQSRANYLKNREKVLERQRLQREADPDKFRRRSKLHYEKNKPAVLAKNRSYLKAHPEKARAATTKWKKSNPDLARQLARATDKKRQKRRVAYQRRWRSLNADDYNAKMRAYRQSHPDETRIADTRKFHKRRARKLATRVGTDTQAYKDFVRLVKTADTLPCYWCKRPTAKGKRHIDHIIPLSKDGADCVTNLCCACIRCNCSKRNRMPDEFLAELQSA